MNQEAEIKLVARVTALEILVRELIVANAEQHDDPPAAARQYAKTILEEHRLATIKGTDPAKSDMLSDELYRALEETFAQVFREMQIKP